MRKRHYWRFVSVLSRLQSKPLLFQGEVKHGGLATFSVGLLHVSHLDSDQCSELQCLPNAFQNLFFPPWLPRFWSPAKVLSSAWLTNCFCTHPWHVKRGLAWNERRQRLMCHGRTFSHFHPVEQSTAWLSVKWNQFIARYLPGCPIDSRKALSNWLRCHPLVFGETLGVNCSLLWQPCLST